MKHSTMGAGESGPGDDVIVLCDESRNVIRAVREPSVPICNPTLDQRAGRHTAPGDTACCDVVARRLRGSPCSKSPRRTGRPEPCCLRLTLGRSFLGSCLGADQLVNRDLSVSLFKIGDYNPCLAVLSFFAPCPRPARQVSADRPTNYALHSPSGSRLRSRTLA